MSHGTRTQSVMSFDSHLEVRIFVSFLVIEFSFSQIIEVLMQTVVTPRNEGV